MPRKLTDKQVTERQLKDAKTLASVPGGFLITKRFRDTFKKEGMGEWYVKKANQ